MRRFAENRQGGVAMQTALIFGAAGLAMALFLAPAMQGIATSYAEKETIGIDRTITGSVSRSANRYIIRSSVLYDEPEVICGSTRSAACAANAR